LSEEQNPRDAEADAPAARNDTDRPRAGRRGRWVWPVVIGALAVLGVLLALANIALNSPWLGPLSQAVVGPAVVASPLHNGLPGADRFERTRPIQSFVFRSPFRPIGLVSPLQGLRALLTNGAALILVALAVLIVFPDRARGAVERLEDRRGPEIALVAGVATLLLTLAALLLLRFTLIFLVLIPVLIAIALAVAIFGIACIALAFGRLMQHKLGLGATHPLVASLAGALIVFDLAVIPYAGLVALAALAVAGLGIAVVTRFGSETGWSFAGLKW
jgi:hypothetical protein